MKLEYLGHACFKITLANGLVWVTDPYDGSVGLARPGVKADVTTLSHGHYDHNCLDALDGAGEVLSKAGTYQVGGAKFTLIKRYHDDVQGAKRGENLLTICEADGLKVCHAGDLGHQPDAELIAQLSGLNALMLPIGGTYTLDGPGAARAVRAIAPRAVIPMHYRVDKLTLNISGPEPFLNEMGAYTTVGRELELTADTAGVIMMKPARG